MAGGCSMEQQVKQQQPEQRVRHMPIKQALPTWVYLALFIVFMIVLMIVDVKYNIGITKIFTGWF